jgi:hypothetical protein
MPHARLAERGSRLMTSNVAKSIADGTEQVEIACDESGSDSENLVEGRSRVFTLGSTDLSLNEAGELMAALRAATGFAGKELKSSTLLKPKYLAAALGVFGRGGVLDGRAKLFLVDKWYMAVCKIVDLVIEEHAYSNGIRLHVTGDARRIALGLFQEGPRAFRIGDWNRLLREFVSFVRTTHRKGTKTTLEELLGTIDDLRLRAHRNSVSMAMKMLWEGRAQLEKFSSGPPDRDHLRTLDPIFPAVFETARAWHDATGMSIHLVHDRQAVLTVETRAVLQRSGAHPHREFPFPVPLRDIELVDSRDDPRVQVADIVAGLGNLVGTAAIEGVLDDPLADVVRPMIIATSLWGDAASWIRLVRP